jgi:hypothetical protein
LIWFLNETRLALTLSVLTLGTSRTALLVESPAGFPR